MKKNVTHFLLITAFTCFFCLFSYLNPGSVDCAETSEAEAFDEDFEFMDEEFDNNIQRIADPLAPVNRIMFKFNDRLYFWVLKPVSKGYKKVVPRFARTGIQNFFYNLRAPIRIVGSLLQLKGEKTMIEYSRFIINTTAGGLGFVNAVKKYPHLNPSKEDSGQTLAHYGIGNGFYIVWPIMGPSSLRDTVGSFGDGLYFDPVSYVKPAEAFTGLKTLDMVNNTSLRIGDYETLKNSAIQPYEAFRNAYIQHRNNLIAE